MDKTPAQTATPRFDTNRLPSLQALHSFYVVAQTTSFTRAATELHLSQSAISRQILQLEEQLGCTLLERNTRKVVITEHGVALLPVVEGLLASLRGMFSTRRPSTRPITIRMPPTFARRWFLPRFQEVKQAFPDLDIKIDTAWFARPSFSTGEIDILVTYGAGVWPGMTVVPLLSERLTPLCAPEQLAVLGDPPRMERLADCVLLHSNAQHSDWTLWLNAEGAYSLRGFAHQVFDTQDFAFTAAAHGYGVAMGDLNFAGEDLANGTLVAPFPGIIDSGYGYFAIYPARRIADRAVADFGRWLEEMASAGKDQ